MTRGVLLFYAAVLSAAAFSFSLKAQLPQSPAAGASAAPAQSLKLLAGHRPEPLAHIQPVGTMDSSAQLPLAIGLPLRNSAELQRRIARMQDRSSADFGRSLSRDEFVSTFSPSPAEYEAAIAYATAHGLQVTCTYSNRLLFDVKGSVANVEKVFHVKLRLYPHPQEKRLFYAPDREPSVDPQFAILNVHGLDNFSIPHPLGLTVQPLATNLPVSFGMSGSGPLGLLVGNDFRNAYVPGVTLNGAGQYIALFEYASYFPEDITTYAQIAGIPMVNVTNISVNGFDTAPPPLGQDVFEQSGDIEVAMSMAPQATIQVYEASDMVDAFNQMASDDLAKQVSCSWGYSGGVDPLLINAINELQAQGQSVFIASGDNGAYTAKDLGNPGGFTNVTICGGTVLTLDQQYGGYQSETTWSGSGGGWATNFPMPAYQQGVNLTANHGSTSQRNIPDVAAVAVNIFGIGYGTNALAGIAGTSMSAPLWAGFLALVNEQRADNGLGSVVNLNDQIYNLGKGVNYSAAFHDITTGNNTNSTIPNNFFAVPGYDLCTGWGTPNGTNLINLLAPATDELQISPGFGFSATEVYNSAAPAASVVFALTNTSSSSVTWNISGGAGWLDTPASGATIPAHGSAQATVYLNGSADSLAPGTYNATVTFTDTSTGVSQNRLFTLTVTAGAQPLSFSGYDAGIIVPTYGTISQPHAVPFGVGANVTFYSAGLPGSTLGLPASGLFQSAWDGQTMFQLGPYGGNNALLLGTNYSSNGTLTLNTAQTLDSLVILAASAFATATSEGICTVHFADGSSQSFTYNAQDWFEADANEALAAFGRIDLGTFVTENDGTQPRLYQTTIPLGRLGLTQPVTSVTFNQASNAVNTAILAMSGVTGPMSGLVPTITQQPQPILNGSIFDGAAFTVRVAGAQPFSYQWYSNSVPLPFGVMPSLSFDPGMSTNLNASYYVVVSNLYGSVQSTSATLTVYRTPPQFTQQPAVTNYSVFAGDTISISSIATNALPITYAWELNGVPISGATNTTLGLNNLQTNNSGIYTLVASTTTGTATNNPVTVNVVPRPSAAYPQTVLQMNPVSYWRLNETSGGIAYDYVGGDNGNYTNVTLGQPGYGGATGTGTEPSELAAQFGPTNGSQSYVSLPNLDVSVPNGGNGEFAIAAWVLASNSVPTGAAVIAKGYGNGDEEFAIDCGGANNAFRFYVRDAQSATAYGAVGNVVPDNNWHFLVGVCDQVHSTIALYVDGTNVAQGGIPANIGIHHSTFQGSIGARASNTGTPEDLQFIGEINDVAIFTNALSASQIFILYQEAQPAPQIVQQPFSVWAGISGGTFANQVIASGVNLSYQWYGPAGGISGATSSTLVLSNVNLAQSGNYYVIVSNLVGAVQSSNAVLTVLPQSQYTSSFDNYLNGSTNFYDGSQLFSTALGTVAELITNMVFDSGIGWLHTPSELQLTAYGSAGATSAFELPDLNPGQPIYAFSAKWNSQVYGDFQNADSGVGLSFNFGDVASLNLTNGNVELGYTNGLCFSVQNSGTNGVFELLMSNNVLASRSYSPLSEWGQGNATRHFFEVDWNYTNGMSVWLDHAPIFTNVATPGFVPKAGNRFVWAARSLTGDTEEVRLANIIVKTGGNLVFLPTQSPYFYDSNTINFDPSADGVHKIADCWEDAPAPGYVGESISSSKPLAAYALSSSPYYSPPANSPGVWTMQGSGDGGTNWSTIAAQTDYFSNAGETRAWLTANSTSAYGAYRLYVNSAMNGSTTIELGALTFYGFNAVGGPAAVTEPPSPVTLATAQLNGLALVSPVPTTAWFQWGTTASYGNATAPQSIGSAGGAIPFNTTLNSLSPEVVYHYRAAMSNQFGLYLGNDVPFSTAINPVVFNTSGVEWLGNQTGPYVTPTINNNLLILTDGRNNEARSVFFQLPQYIGAFKASFTYAGSGADGAAFVLQNDPRGLSALGGAGGSLGYGPTNPITPSAALELNIYNGDGQTVGYTFLTNGLTGAGGANGNYHAPGAINLASGHPIGVTMNYANSLLALSFTDAVAGLSFSTNLNVGQLTNVVGGATAFIGFTGSDGGVPSTQIITNFSFVSIPTVSISVTNGQVMISWPSAMSGFTLQQNYRADLESAGWLDMTNTPAVVNGQFQFTVPLTATNTFYRLKLFSP